MLYRMRGHSDTVTGMQLSPDGSYLLSNSMDNTGNQSSDHDLFHIQVNDIRCCLCGIRGNNSVS